MFEDIKVVIEEETTSQEPVMRKAELSKLVERAGGTVLKSLPKNTENVYYVKILSVQENSQDYSKRKPSSKKINYANRPVSHRWILDSISSYKVLEPSIYLV